MGLDIPVFQVCNSARVFQLLQQAHQLARVELACRAQLLARHRPLLLQQRVVNRFQRLRVYMRGPGLEIL